MENMQEKITEALKKVFYPGFGKDIVSLGMVKELAREGNKITVVMNFVSASDEVKQKLTAEIKDALLALAINADVEFPSAPSKGGHDGPPPKQPIKGVKHVLPVASGKGGVGKSTTSVNLAVALARQGHKVGLLDLDVYGPSIPTMLGIEGQQHSAGDDGKLVPTDVHGIRVVSIGLLLDKGAPLIWRGPLVAKLVKQLMYEVNWGELDFLVLDLPPGTGDVQLTLVQNLPIAGAVVVTTPQDVALADVTKAVNMFNKTETEVVGIIENMSVFVCPHCRKESHIFGRGGGKKESERAGVPLLGEIPLEGKIAETSDAGNPIALSDDGIGNVYSEIARKVAAVFQNR